MNFDFFCEIYDNYNIIEIKTQAWLYVFQMCVYFMSLGRDGFVISGVSGGVSVNGDSGNLVSDRKLRGCSKSGVSGGAVGGVLSVFTGGGFSAGP